MAGSDFRRTQVNPSLTEVSPGPILVKMKSQAGIEDKRGNPCPLSKKDLVKFPSPAGKPGRVNPYPHSKKDLVKFEISNFKNRQNRQFSKGGPLQFGPPSSGLGQISENRQNCQLSKGGPLQLCQNRPFSAPPSSGLVKSEVFTQFRTCQI